MGQLIYLATASLDGYVEDEQGGIDWSAPDDDVFRFVNDQLRPVGTFLFGRRMYETMLYWETTDFSGDQPDGVHDFNGIWQAADKIVYSRTLASTSSARTRLAREFDPRGVQVLKETSGHPLSVGGSDLATQAINSGLVDELHLLVVPVVLGGGKSWLQGGVRVGLELLGTRRFAGGTVYLRYRPNA